MMKQESAPGMRVIIRDEEWMIKKVETNTLGNKSLHCIGISTLVKDNVDSEEYLKRIPSTPWEEKYTSYYRLAGRKMVDVEGERTLMPALIPPSMGHTNGVIGFAFKDNSKLIQALCGFCSLPYDSS